MTEFEKYLHLEIEQIRKDQRLHRTDYRDGKLVAYGYALNAFKELSKDKPCDNFVVKFSDNEIQLVTRQQLEIWQKQAMDFDGFEGWIVKGKLSDE